jgi:hypothetical protein
VDHQLVTLFLERRWMLAVVGVLGRNYANRRRLVPTWLLAFRHL